MAKSRLEQLEHWESTSKGHQVSDMVKLLRAFGYEQTGESNNAGNEFVNGDKSEYFKVDNSSAYVTKATQKTLVELCRAELTEEERKGELTPLSVILKQEQDTLTDLEENYGIEVSIARNGKDIVFECEGAALRKYIKREGSFNLSAEAEGFIEELEEINFKSEDRLAELKDKAHSCSEQLGVKHTLTYGNEAVDVNLFGIGYIDVKDLKAAEKLFKKVDRTLEEEEQKQALKPHPVITKTPDSKPEPEEALAAETESKPSAEPVAAAAKPEAIDMTRTITGGKMLKEHVENKQFMWDTLKKALGISNDKKFQEVLKQGLKDAGIKIRDIAISEFLNPQYKYPPRRQDRQAVASFRNELVRFIRETENDDRLSRGTTTKFDAAFRDIQRQMETKKDQELDR